MCSMTDAAIKHRGKSSYSSSLGSQVFFFFIFVSKLPFSLYLIFSPPLDKSRRELKTFDSDAAFATPAQSIEI